MRARLVLRMVALTAVVVVPANADAPDDQYEPFIGDSTSIKDAYTKLVWLRRAVEPPMNYTAALTECQKGNQGYRLPTMKELLSLVDESPNDEYDQQQLKTVSKYIDDFVFPNTPVSKSYWTLSVAGGNEAWTVDFADGLTKKVNTGDTRYVRCVKFVGP